MSLTGRPFLFLLIFLTVALPIATMFLWTRVRPGALSHLTRGIGIVASQLCAVMLAAVLVNNYGYFYNSWSELFAAGDSSSGVHVDSAPLSHGGAASPLAGGVKVSGYLNYSAPAQWSSKGRMDNITISGASSGLNSHAYVYLPPQYFQPSFAHHIFPAAEILTGYPGNIDSLVGRMHYPDVMAREVAKHRADPIVMVLMRPSITYPQDTECSDVPAGPQALTFFAQDVPAGISGHYRVRPNAWGAMGDSTGGYCAAKLAMLYPTNFPAAVALSGYFNALKDSTTGDLWGGSPQLRQLNDLSWRLKNQPAPDTSLLLTTSKDEGGSEGFGNTAAFLKLVKPPLKVDTIIEQHGGHNFSTWGREMGPALSWLSAKLRTTAP